MSMNSIIVSWSGVFSSLPGMLVEIFAAMFWLHLVVGLPVLGVLPGLWRCWTSVASRILFEGVCRVVSDSNLQVSVLKPQRCWCHGCWNGGPSIYVQAV